MEENTMSKNDAEESRSVSDEPEVESVPERHGIDSDHVVRADEERRAARSRSDQTDGRISQESRRASRASEEERTGRRVSRTSEEEQAIRRASRTSEEEQAIRRASRTSEEEQAIRRASRTSEEEQAIRRASQASERERTGRRASRTSEEEQAIRRASQASERERTGRRASRTSEEEQAIRRASRASEEERTGRRVSRTAGEGQTGNRRAGRTGEREIQSGQFGLGHKKTKRSAVAYLFEDIAEAFVRARNWCVKNYRTSIPAAICLILVIVVACILVRNFHIKQEPAAEVVQEYPLEKDAYENINNFFQKYYEACAWGDVDTYVSLRSYTDLEGCIRMQKKADYIDYYQNISCYTQPGPVEDSYLVYVYYEVKFTGIHTTPPGLRTYYLRTNDEGELYVDDAGQVDKNVEDYMRTVYMQEDVKDLFTRVHVMYTNAVASDKELEDFLDTLSDNLKYEVTVALMEQEERIQSEENGGGSEEDLEPDPDLEEPEPTPEVEPEPQADMVMTTERVNVRSSASPEATKLGTVAAGTRFTRYEVLENGWSKIEYEGKEAYIKTEFLQVIEAAIGKVKAIVSVNVRASASEDATKLGTVSVGTTMDLIETLENGWSRILFNGSTAYVKTEYLETVTTE